MNEDYLENPNFLLHTLLKIFKLQNQIPEKEILEDANISIEQTGFDNWNGGTEIYSIYFTIPVTTYAKYENMINDIEKSLSDKISTLFRKYTNVWIGEVLISPSIDQNGRLKKDNNYSISDDELIKEIDAIRNIMISVSTGGARIQDVNNKYIEKYEKIEKGLEERNIENPNPYRNLWDWYGKWSSGDLPTYRSRRQYISDLLLPVIDAIKRGRSGSKIFNEPTGWTRVDRTINEIRKRLADAQTEEQYQVVGLLARETLITLAQIVYDPSLHGTIDGIKPSDTDAKRMLEAYLNKELSGSVNEAARRHAKAALTLANDLTHRRTASFRDTALCAEAVSSVVNIVAIISGQRNP